jgi:hypothetical protein
MAYYNNNNNNKDEGMVSGWNEGDLKNLRLHNIQTAINYYKTNPLVRDEYGVYGYDNWFRQIECLYDEGKSKYSSTEKQEVNKMIELIEFMMENNPVYKTVFINGYGAGRRSETLQQNNWKDLQKMLRIFEDKVKYFNDVHGLSTRNIDYEEEGL